MIEQNLTASPALPRRARPRQGVVPVVAAQVMVLVGLLAIWQVAATLHWVNGFLLGSPVGVWDQLLAWWHSGTLGADIGATALETLSGFAAGTVVGTGLGLAFWYWPAMAKVLQPLAVAFNGIPKIALGPLVIIWFGTGETSKVILAFAATVVVALLATYQGALELDPDYERLMRAFGASKGQIFRRLIIPGTMPWIVNAMRINVGLALVGAVIGEFIASQQGLGHAVFVAGNLFELNTVWVGVILLSLMAVALYGLVNLVEQLAIRGRPWS